MHVIDAAGNPIIVTALLEYSIEDPAALHIALSSDLTVLFNMAEQVIREACTGLPLLGENGHDIRSQTVEIGDRMVKQLQVDANVFGVAVLRVAITEARYSPDVASQLLQKQTAMATLAAREQIVAGALNVVRDTLRVFPTLSDSGKERLIMGLLITLTSHVQTTPTMPVA